MSNKQKPVCEAGPKWLKEVALSNPARIGLKGPTKGIFAPLTGQDHKAYLTFLHALQLWGYSDSEGREHALVCMKHAVKSMQPQTQWIARATIPHLLDWEDQQKLWPTIMSAVAERDLLESLEGLLAYLREFWPLEPLFSTFDHRQAIAIRDAEVAIRNARGERKQ